MFKIFFPSLFFQISDGKNIKNENFYRKFQQMVLYLQINFFSAILVSQALFGNLKGPVDLGNLR